MRTRHTPLWLGGLSALAVLLACATSAQAQTVRDPPSWMFALGGGMVTSPNEDPDAYSDWDPGGTVGAMLQLRSVSGNRAYLVTGQLNPLYQKLAMGRASMILGKRYNAAQTTLINSTTIGNTTTNTYLVEPGKVYRGIWGLELGANLLVAEDNVSPQAQLGLAFMGQHTMSVYGLFDAGAMRPGGGIDFSWFIGPFVMNIRMDVVGGNWKDAATGMNLWMGIGGAQNRF